METMKPPPIMTEEEFVVELQRRGFRVETLPNGEQIIHGLRLKTPEELRAEKKNFLKE
jgi:hypothetical protein